MIIEHTASRPVTHTDPNHEPMYLARPPAWMSRGVCATAPAEYRDHWFDSPGTADNKDARLACLACPVLNQCAAFAISEEISHGSWGGMSETELRRCVQLVKDHRQREARLAREERRRTPRCRNNHVLTDDNRNERGNCLICHQNAELTRHGRYKRRVREQRERESA